MATQTAATSGDKRLTAILLVLVAFLFTTSLDTCAKIMVLAGLPPTEVVFVRYAAHTALVLALALPSVGLRLFRTEALGLELLRALALLIGTILNFTAVRYLPLTLTSAIFFTVPLWVCALSVPFLGERVGLRRWVAILIGFAGVLIATRPWSADAHWAVLLSIGAAFATAVYVMLTRRLADVDATATQQFYAAGVSTLGVAPIAFTGWAWPSAPEIWLAFALIGVFGWAGHQLLTVAHKYAPASTLAPFIYFQIIYMTASSWIFFNEPPDAWVVAGAAIVILSGLYIWMRERRLAARTEAVASTAAP